MIKLIIFYLRVPDNKNAPKALFPRCIVSAWGWADIRTVEYETVISRYSVMDINVMFLYFYILLLLYSFIFFYIPS